MGTQVRRDNQNRILVIAMPYSGIPNSIETSTLVYRFLPNGNPDLSFGNFGYVQVQGLSSTVIESSQERLVISEEDDLTIGGIDPVTLSPKIIRLRSNGSVDTSFGNNGIYMLRGQFLNDQEGALTLGRLSNGQILASYNNNNVQGASGTVTANVIRTWLVDSPDAGIRDIQAIQSTDLVNLSINNNAITSTTALANQSHLANLSLRGNRIDSASTLSGVAIADDAKVEISSSDAPSTSYQEYIKVAGVWVPAVASNNPWLGNLNSFNQSVHADYRIVAQGTETKAEWTLTDLVPDDYDVFVSYWVNEANASNVSYSIRATDLSPVGGYSVADRGSFTANQKLTADTTTNSVKWYKLGRVRVDATGANDRLGSLVVQLTNANADGLVIADGVKLVRKTQPLSAIATLDLRDNPLNNDSYDVYSSVLSANVTGSPNYGTLLMDPAPAFTNPLPTVAPLTIAPGASATFDLGSSTSVAYTSQSDRPFTGVNLSSLDFSGTNGGVVQLRHRPSMD